MSVTTNGHGLAIGEAMLKPAPGGGSDLFRRGIAGNGTVRLLTAGRVKVVRPKSSGQFIGHAVPEAESISPGVTVGDCREAEAFRVKEGGYLVMVGEEYLRLFGQFDTAHDLFTPSGMLV